NWKSSVPGVAAIGGHLMNANEKRTRVYPMAKQARCQSVAIHAEQGVVNRDAIKPWRQFSPSRDRLQPYSGNRRQVIGILAEDCFPASNCVPPPLKLGAENSAGDISQAIIVPDDWVKITPIPVHALRAKH